MTEYLYTLADFTNQVMKALPSGPIWNKNPGSDMYQAIMALMQPFVDEHQRAANLLVEAYPATTIELLPAFQASLGLPNSCSIADPTLAQAQQQVVAKFAGTLGSSVAYLIQYAANLGYTITISEFSPWNPVYSDLTGAIMNTANYIQVNIPSSFIEYFQSGHSALGQALGTTGSYAVIECEMASIIPATATLYFVVI